MLPLNLIADAQPTYDLWYAIGLLSRVAHTTCAATLFGGLIYLRFVLAPASAADDREAALFAGRRGAWAALVGGSTGLLLISGFYNFFSFMGAYKNLPALYHPLFGVKFLLALGIMAIMALVAGKTKLAGKVRGSLSLWLNLALVYSLATYALGAVLRSYRDLPDARAAVPVAEEAPAFTNDPILTNE